MRLATVSTRQGLRAARLDGETPIDLGVATLDEFLRRDDWREAARGASEPIASGAWRMARPFQGRVDIFCVGLNYRQHILEMNRELPEYPTIFSKFSGSLVGPEDDIVLPPESSFPDWEAELAVVIGRPVRRADEEEAAAAVAGFTILNDVTMRDWQGRTSQWLQGKSFERTTPIGPWLVTPDELPGGVAPRLRMECRIGDDLVQSADTGDLLFGPVALVQYLSTFITLNPGDIIATGTPGGVGHAMEPRRRLEAGDVVTTSIEGLGAMRNTCVVG